MLKPDLKKLLLVYSSQAGLQESAKEIETISKKLGIELSQVAVYQTNELQQKVEPFINRADAILVLKDSTVVAGMDVLVKLCNKYHVTLLASDLDSADKGAAMAFGVYEYDIGVLSSNIAKQILRENKKVSEIRVKIADDFKIKINSKTLKKQNLKSVEVVC